MEENIWIRTSNLRFMQMPGGYTILQQAWLCCTGPRRKDIEWRNIPLVEADAPMVEHAED